MIKRAWGFFFGTKPIKYVKPKTVAKLFAEPGVVIADIRPGAEFKTKRITGSASLSQTSFVKKSRKLLHPSYYVIIVCRNGYVSPNAYHVLKQRNFKHVYVLKGGISAFEKQYPELIASIED